MVYVLLRYIGRVVVFVAVGSALVLALAPDAFAFGITGKDITESWGRSNPDACASSTADGVAACVLAQSMADICINGASCSTGSSGCTAGSDALHKNCTFSYTRSIPNAGIFNQAQGGSFVAQRLSVSESCKPNATNYGGTCYCSAGFTLDTADNCAPQTNCTPGAMSEHVQVIGAGQSSLCQGGCATDIQMKATGVDGKLYGWASKLTGGFCLDVPGFGDNVSPDAVGDGNSGAPMSPQCGLGKCSGTVNGVQVCVACSTATVEGPAAAASAPPGASAPILSPSAPPGATSSSTSTSCASGGSCTTVTTWFNNNGDPLGTSSETEGKDSFCVDNPSSPLCEKSTIAGSCGAVTCTGDAIQCAIAKEQAKRNCELWDAAPGNHKGVLAANGQAMPDGHPGNDAEETNIGFATTIDTSNALGGGNCPSDFGFAVGGVSLSIPFSTLCPHLAVLGLIVQGFAMLAAAFIVFKG